VNNRPVSNHPVSTLVLALDTTHEFGSLALVNEEGVIEEMELHSPEGFGHVIFGEIEALLARNRLNLNDVDVFAASSGPGSFTGVRIGLTAVKGLAEAAGKKVIAISNLQALASFGLRKLRAVVMDARRGEVYGAVYDQHLEVVQDEAVCKLPDWLNGVARLGDDVEMIATGDTLVSPDIQIPQTALAGAIGWMAVRQIKRGLANDPAEIDANYVRRSDAELFWKDPVVTG
jgi:tRNA threonylcarbamoyladenosine biosynthesis protein TsaB